MSCEQQGELMQGETGRLQEIKAASTAAAATKRPVPTQPMCGVPSKWCIGKFSTRCSLRYERLIAREGWFSRRAVSEVPRVARV